MSRFRELKLGRLTVVVLVLAGVRIKMSRFRELKLLRAEDLVFGVLL